MEHAIILAGAVTVAIFTIAILSYLIPRRLRSEMKRIEEALEDSKRELYDTKVRLGKLKKLSDEVEDDYGD